MKGNAIVVSSLYLGSQKKGLVISKIMIRAIISRRDQRRYQDEKTENKADKHLTSFKETIKVKKINKIEIKELKHYIHQAIL